MKTLKPSLTYLIPKLIALTEQAGRLICNVYKEEVKVYEKNDGSPVTKADRESHLLFKKGLEDITPDIPLVSEEDESSWFIKTDRYWLIDPLDGTKGFINKNGQFCINIALIEKNKPIFGLIHIPLSQETFYGYGGTAWRHLEGETTSIHTRFPPLEGMTLLLGGHGEKFKKEENFFLKTYPIAKIKHIQSAIKFCAIALGDADLYLRFEKCYEWDTAAGQAIVEAAGGIMTKLDGSPIVYGKPDFLNKEFVVFGKKP